MAKSNLKPIEPRLLNIADASAFLGMGVWKLRRLVWAAEIKPLDRKKGAALQFDVRDLEKWIESKKQEI
jgi:hypothetical protein